MGETLKGGQERVNRKREVETVGKSHWSMSKIPGDAREDTTLGTDQGIVFDKKKRLFHRNR